MRRPLMASALALAALCATGSLAEAPAEQTVTVELSSFKFTPATLTLQHGRNYRLHLSNTASGGHNFVAKEFFAASTVAPEDRGKIGKGRVDVARGQSIDIRLIPNTVGIYKLRCSHFMHSTFGMTGAIVIQ